VAGIISICPSVRSRDSSADSFESAIVTGD